jgi:pimeloyl-ACP methyl ester carboxylesterase
MRLQADRRTLAALVAGGGAAAGIALQLAHVRRIARDPEYKRLSAFESGRDLAVSSADGTRIHAEVFGPEGARTVVLVHGWTERISVWGPVITALLAKGLRVVAYDLRGHGESEEGVDDDYSLERFGEDLEAVLAAALPEGELATVAGHSLGGMAIAAWAEHHEVGRRACATVLMNTGFSRMIAESRLLPALSWLFTEPVARRLLMGSRAPVPSFSSPLEHSVLRYAAFGPTATSGQVAFYERMLISCPVHVRAACGLAISDMDLDHAVERLTAPTVVLTGDRDRLTPSAHAQRIADALPALERLIELPETGHMSLLERPGEVSAAIVDLAARCAPDSAVTTA